MKKIFLTLACIPMLLALAPVPAYALTDADCPAGQKVYTDYSVESGRQYCGPIENQTGNEQQQTITQRDQLSTACQQNTVNCSPNEKAFLNSIVTPPGIVSPPECSKLGGYWNENGYPYKCEFTPEVYKNTYNLNPSTPAANPAVSSNSAGTKLTYTPLEPLPGADASIYTSLGKYFNYMFTLALSIGAMVAIVTLVLAGITYMVSEVVDKKSQAKERIRGALWGLMLLLTSWLILNTINPNLLNFSFFDTKAGTSAPSNTASSQTTPSSSSSLQPYVNSLLYNPANPDSAAQLVRFSNECQAKGGYMPGATPNADNLSVYTCAVAP